MNARKKMNESKNGKRKRERKSETGNEWEKEINERWEKEINESWEKEIRMRWEKWMRERKWIRKGMNKSWMKWKNGQKKKFYELSKQILNGKYIKWGERGKKIKRRDLSWDEREIFKDKKMRG